jgi:Arc/MetJ family transcription regulator
MPTNLGIDDKLLKEAQKVGGHSTKKATVNEALQEYIQRRKQARIIELFGTIDYDPDYDPRKLRGKR